MIRTSERFVLAVLVPMALLAAPPSAPASDQILEHGRPWSRHAIDDRFDGPDGTKLADINGDGLLDVVTGWESEGLTVVYLHPGYRFARRSWPSVVVGHTPKAEDAVFVDLNNDGAIDVVTCSEQRVEQVFIHWAPTNRSKLLIPQQWRQSSVASAKGISQWMFAEPIRILSQKTPSLVVGGKNYKRDQSAPIGLLTPKASSGFGEFDWRPLTWVSWTMSIIVDDVNLDGRPDIIYSDKHGPGCGVWWLEHPDGDAVKREWVRHKVTDHLDSAMLIDLVDVNQDGFKDIVAPVDLLPEGKAPKKRAIRLLWKLDKSGQRWGSTDILTPPRSGQPKAATAGDVNGDGRIDLVVTSTGAIDGQMGAYWLEYRESPTDPQWLVHRISGPEGIKFDLVHLIDIDGDGDLDVLTNEEKQDGKGLGVFWYENPRLAVGSDRSK